MTSPSVTPDPAADALASLRGALDATSKADLLAAAHAVLDRVAEQEATDPTARFLTFHAENPHVYRLLAREARRYREATRSTKCGIGLIWERLRWVLAVETTDESPRLNDHYCPYYARLLMDREADLRGMFDVQAALADDDTTWLRRAA